MKRYQYLAGEKLPKLWAGRWWPGENRESLSFFRRLRKDVHDFMLAKGLTPDPATLQILKAVHMFRIKWALSMKSKEREEK